MAKLHGDFGDMSRYDLVREGARVSLVCQDCSTKEHLHVLCEWPLPIIPLAQINRIAAEHETQEERT